MQNHIRSFQYGQIWKLGNWSAWKDYGMKEKVYYAISITKEDEDIILEEKCGLILYKFRKMW